MSVANGFRFDTKKVLIPSPIGQWQQNPDSKPEGTALVHNPPLFGLSGWVMISIDHNLND
jgi:hypothetical protein